MKKKNDIIKHGLYWEEGTPDEDSPELTAEDFRNARPFKEVFPELYEQWKRGKGRPKLANPKREVKLRLDADIVDRFKSQGRGWMTRMNDALKHAASQLPQA